MLNYIMELFTETGLIVDLILIFTGVAIYGIIKEEQK